MSGRKTKSITYNLFDRGRKHTGQDRGNVNKKVWIDLINSPVTQEMISTGSMYGYYGHQIRMLFGIMPPETAPLGGKIVTLSPALRTIEMTCDSDGNVTHRQEFLDTPEGNHALEKYSANIGGFSAAHDYEMVNGEVVPNLCAGMDYVLQPNYVNNIGDGMLMDSMISNDFVRRTVEGSLIEMYDSIFSSQFANHQADSNLMRAIAAENQLIEEQEKAKRRKELLLRKDENMYDAMLCPVMSINEYMKTKDQFLFDSVIPDLEQKQLDESEKYKPKVGLFGWLL